MWQTFTDSVVDGYGHSNSSAEVLPRSDPFVPERVGGSFWVWTSFTEVQVRPGAETLWCYWSGPYNSRPSLLLSSSLVLGRSVLGTLYSLHDQ